MTSFVGHHLEWESSNEGRKLEDMPKELIVEDDSLTLATPELADMVSDLLEKKGNGILLGFRFREGKEIDEFDKIDDPYIPTELEKLLLSVRSLPDEGFVWNGIHAQVNSEIVNEIEQLEENGDATIFEQKSRIIWNKLRELNKYSLFITWKYLSPDHWNIQEDEKKQVSSKKMKKIQDIIGQDLLVINKLREVSFESVLENNSRDL